MRPLAPPTPRPSLTPSRARTADLGPTCQSYPPPQYVDGWHTAQGQVSGSGAVSLSFQLRAGPQKWTGQLSGNGTRIVWAQPPPAPPGPGPGPGPGPNPSLPTVPPGAWVRDGTDALQQAGTLTSISLTACTSASAGNISNRDSYLRCAGSVLVGLLLRSLRRLCGAAVNGQTRRLRGSGRSQKTASRTLRTRAAIFTTRPSRLRATGVQPRPLLPASSSLPLSHLKSLVQQRRRGA